MEESGELGPCIRRPDVTASDLLRQLSCVRYGKQAVFVNNNICLYASILLFIGHRLMASYAENKSPARTLRVGTSILPDLFALCMSNITLLLRTYC